MTRAMLTAAALVVVVVVVRAREAALDRAASWAGTGVRWSRGAGAECVDCSGPCRVCGVVS